MKKGNYKYVYGPVPSRRLGRSLGVDLVPFKTCTYDCIYCQLGRTTQKTVERREYLPTGAIIDELKEALAENGNADYITISGSGEPTLHVDIGTIIGEIKSLSDIPVAVITNSSLMHDDKVRTELLAADLVLPSLDAGSGSLFEYVNRPHKKIRFREMLDGLIEFRKQYKNKMWLEIFLLAGINIFPDEMEKLAGLVSLIAPEMLYLNTATRPPCEEYAVGVNNEHLHELAEYFDCTVKIAGERVNHSEMATGGALVDDQAILAILSRRPCTVEDIAEGLRVPVNSVIKSIYPLVNSGMIAARRGNDSIFYERQFSK